MCTWAMAWFFSGADQWWPFGFAMAIVADTVMVVSVAHALA